LEEIQTLSIVPNVFYTLTYKGQTTEPISYLASNSEVQTALNALASIAADGGVVVSDHPDDAADGTSDVDLLISFNDPGFRDLIEVNPSGMRQPVTVEAELNSDRLKPGGSLGVAGDATTSTSQVQPLRIGPEITVFVPAGAGPQTLRWIYEKTGNAAGYQDAAWVDQLEIYDFPANLSELVLTNIDYTPGTYVLDVDAIVDQPETKLGTRFLDISVEAQNQGQDLPPALGAFTSADMEVRLSTDRIYGNDGDYVLGSFNQIEGTLQGGELLRYIGGLPLGNHIPEGDYYLIARIDPNDRLQEEHTKSNNIFITQNNDVTVERRPRLLIQDPDPLDEKVRTRSETSFIADFTAYDEARLYNPEAPMRVELQIQNIGLDDLYDENGQIIEWATQVNLVGILKDDLIITPPPDDFVDSFTDPLLLRDFNVAQAMQGRREAVPSGDVIEIDLELNIPNAFNIESILEDDRALEDYMFFLQFIVDVNDTVIESGITNVWNNVDYGSASISSPLDPSADVDDGLFQIAGFFPTNLATWKSLYGLPLSSTAEEELLAYAFGRNPDLGDTGVNPINPDDQFPITNTNQFPGSFGYEVIDTESYLSATFDFARYADDIQIIVKAADTIPDLDLPTSKILRIVGPFDRSTGPFSLNDDGGLIDEPQVIAAVDLGQLARVTVIDTEPVSQNPSRFMRFEVVQGLETFTTDAMNALYGVSGGSNRASDDFDSDEKTNLIELLYGTDPTDPLDTPVLNAADVFVAELLANYGVAGVSEPDIGPNDDYDGDGFSNIVELMEGTNPNDSPSNRDRPDTSDLGVYVIESLAQSLATDEFGVNLENIGPLDDFDEDGASNIAELQLGRDPVDDSDAGTTTALEDFVAERFAVDYEIYDSAIAGDISPTGDYDGDGASNIAELQLGRNPIDDVDVGLTTNLENDVAEDFAVIYDIFGPAAGAGSILPNGDYDLDEVTNSVEIDNGTDPTDGNDF
jgi:hypothetical protein